MKLRSQRTHKEEAITLEDQFAIQILIAESFIATGQDHNSIVVKTDPGGNSSGGPFTLIPTFSSSWGPKVRALLQPAHLQSEGSRFTEVALRLST